jgi:S1-C subfamily serine protease
LQERWKRSASRTAGRALAMPALRIPAAAIATSLLLGACSTSLGNDPAPTAATTSHVELRQSDEPVQHSSVASMVRRVLPSVVNVRVTSLQTDAFGGTQEARGEGSGVIIDRDGIILTNNHVIRGAVQVTVVLNDGTRVDGRVIGAAPERDLAVVKVDSKDLTPITLGHSDDLQLGDAVVAIGFPLGLGGPTVTKGIVSGKDRNISVGDGATGAERLEGLLQTDAAINPGNSGGALVDTSGRLVGINSAAALASSAENIGFAIAIDSALPVIDQILTQPREKQAWLGVSVSAVDPIVAGQLGLPSDTQGAAVVGVFPDSPARDAGIERGDVIVSVAGEDIATTNDLTHALARHAPNDRVEVEVLSSSGRRTVEVTLSERPVSLG